MVNRAPMPAGTTFQGHDPEEQFQFYFRQHWIRMLWPFTRTLLATLALLAAGWWMLIATDMGGRLTALFLLGCLILVQFDFLVRFYRYFLYIIVITDKRVHRIKKTLLAVDEHQSVDLWVLQDIHKSQRGVMQNLFGFGTLVLEAQQTHMTIHFAPNVSQCYGRLTHLHEQARARLRLPEEKSGESIEGNNQGR